MANFTPVLGDYTELKPFRFWCQKVLPLVYDDSLSYYELLCKVVDYLNKTMEDVDTLHTDVENLHTAYEQLQKYVNDYFDNLDVQEEINNKLDAMAQDGSLTNLIRPLIPDIVTDWLNEHITPTTPAIDNTLTVSGAGADAKVVGDNFKVTYKIKDITPYIQTDSQGQYVDFNDVTETGMYLMDTSLRKLNAPSGDINVLNVEEYYTNFIKQTAYSITRTSTKDIEDNTLVRYKNNEGWLSWRHANINIESDKIYALKDITPYIQTDSQGDYVDFNTVTVTGMYLMETSLRKLNAPSGDINVLNVEEYYTNFIKQTAYSITRTSTKDIEDNTLVRYKNNEGWLSWRHVNIDSDKIYALKDITPYIQTDSQGDYVDFNTVTETGMYLMDTSLRKLNAPSGEINVLNIEEYYTDFIKQTAYSITYHSTPTIDNHVYNRYKNTLGWLDWYKTASEFDIRVLDHSLKLNSYDLLYKYVYDVSQNEPEQTIAGIDYKVYEDGSIHIEGERTTNGYLQIWYGAMPEEFKPNSDLYVKMNSSSGNVTLRIYFYDSSWTTRQAYFCSTDTTIHVPSYASNLIIWFGTEYNNISIDETCKPAILTQPSVGSVINNNTFNYTVHSDTYNVTATPTITAVSDYYLAPTGDTTDRTNDIMTMLATNKVCKLGTGDYYIRTGIDMPDNTSLIGSGRGTRLILDSSITEGYTISVGSFCTVQDMTIIGSLTNLPYSDYEVGKRDGIVQLGDYENFTDPATFSANCDKLSNLWIENFTGSGIRAYRNDGAASFLAENIDILRCGIGINIELFSEFHAFENIRTRWCVYACIMNGGNNLFSNCHFDVCIHLLKVDNSLSNLINDSHSSFTNCTFCHANNNTGNAIEVLNVGNGLVFSNCQVFYSKIILTDTRGVVITNFNFGNSENIILTRCKGINISNCIFGSAPNVTVNDVTGLIFENNMTRNGVAVTL